MQLKTYPTNPEALLPSVIQSVTFSLWDPNFRALLTNSAVLLRSELLKIKSPLSYFFFNAIFCCTPVSCTCYFLVSQPTYYIIFCFSSYTASELRYVRKYHTMFPYPPVCFMSPYILTFALFLEGSKFHRSPKANIFMLRICYLNYIFLTIVLCIHLSVLHFLRDLFLTNCSC